MDYVEDYRHGICEVWYQGVAYIMVVFTPEVSTLVTRDTGRTFRVPTAQTSLIEVSG